MAGYKIPQMILSIIILVTLALFLLFVVYSCLAGEEMYREMFDDTTLSYPTKKIRVKQEPTEYLKEGVKLLKVRHK